MYQVQGNRYWQCHNYCRQLQNNRITSIDRCAFSSLPELETLWASTFPSHVIRYIVNIQYSLQQLRIGEFGKWNVWWTKQSAEIVACSANYCYKYHVYVCHAEWPITLGSRKLILNCLSLWKTLWNCEEVNMYADMCACSLPLHTVISASVNSSAFPLELFKIFLS